MCGIAGWFDPDASGGEADTARLRRMCDTIRHRGPDDDGYAVHPVVALGMRRLAVVDVAGGHQPMASEDGVIELVFNGEIFNHEALRAELSSQGVHFRTRSDTEVVLRIYERDGLTGLNRLNGMFAIAIWDGRQRILRLIRDRMGVKPLYYAWDGKRLIFGSEIKAILAGMAERPPINDRAIWDYLTFRYVPPPHTMWQGIFKLPAAHHLTIAMGDAQPKVKRWWDIPRPDGRPLSDARAIEAFDGLITDATRLRMLADVPIGILLSGGLDSSVVAAKAARGGPRIKTFSVAFDGAVDIDERRFARLAAAAFDTDHHEIVIGEKDFVDFLPDFVHYTDEPLADLASIPLYFVCRLARETVTVVLSGEGADEILGGYSFDQWAIRWDEAAAKRPASMLSWLGRKSPPVDPGLLDLRAARVPLTMTDYLTSEEKRCLLRPGVDHPDSLDGLRSALARFGKASPLAQALYLYSQDWLVEDLLMKADKMSMATSVELRTPFLDYRVVEAAARLPDHLRVGRGSDGTYETKRILRAVAKSSGVPEAIITRSKMGFPVPVYGWLSGTLKGFAHDLLVSERTKLRAWCDNGQLQDLVACGTAGDAKSDTRHRLWNAMILELWMRHWL